MPGLNHNAEFFRLVHSMRGNHPLEGLDYKLFFVDWFFQMVEKGGMREWAQVGAEGIRYARELVCEAGLSELVEALDAWINAIPGGLDQIDGEFDVVYEPHVDELDNQVYNLLMREGDGYAARYLAWYRTQR